MAISQALEFHLSNWALWKSTGGGVEGFPSQVKVFRSAHNASSEDGSAIVWEIEMRRCAAILDTLIEDRESHGCLSEAERAAVFHVWLQAVYHFNRHSFEEVLGRAYIKIKRGMDKWGLV